MNRHKSRSQHHCFRVHELGEGIEPQVSVVLSTNRKAQFSYLPGRLQGFNESRHASEEELGSTAWTSQLFWIPVDNPSTSPVGLPHIFLISGEQVYWLFQPSQHAPQKSLEPGSSPNMSPPWASGFIVWWQSRSQNKETCHNRAHLSHILFGGLPPRSAPKHLTLGGYRGSFMSGKKGVR